MTTAEVNKSLIGKKVKCIFTGLETTGTIEQIVENKHSKGVEIKFDRPVVWGDYAYEKYESTARKFDEFGNLQFTEII